MHEVRQKVHNFCCNDSKARTSSFHVVLRPKLVGDPGNILIAASAAKVHLRFPSIPARGNDHKIYASATVA